MPSVLSKLLSSTLPSIIWVKAMEWMAGFGPRVFSRLSDEGRLRIIDALRRMLRYLQNGFDVGWQYAVSAPSIRAAIATLIYANLFKPWAEVGWGPRTAEELTQMSESGADVELIRRLLDALVSQKFFIKNNDQYQGWEGSWADDLVKDPTLAGQFLYFYDWSSIAMANLPRFLAKTGFRSPTDTQAGNYQDIHGSSSLVYNPPLGDAVPFEKLKSILAQDEKLREQLFSGKADIFEQLDALLVEKSAPLLPEWAQHVSDFMESHSRYNHRPWTDLFPTNSIVKDTKKDRKLVVDIGGGKGHDSLRFARLHPEIPDGSVVVQDLPHVLDAARTFDGQKKVVPMAYDYLDPQPIKGARVYYIHVVIHNADDARAITVLKNVVAAMEKGYSQLLIHESVIDVHDPHANATSQDIFMMGMFAAQERTRERWVYVIQEAGLRIVEIQMKKGFPDAVIVTEKA